MTKRLVTSDWQLCDNPRDRYRTAFVVDQLPKLIDKYKPDQLLVLGDITEQKDNHPAPLVNEIVNAFYQLQKKCQVIVLQGNHDFLHKDHPYLQFITNFGVKWISVPTVLDNCLYLPHTRDHKKDWANIDFNGHDYIFAHNIFTGVSTQTGHALSGISPSIFPKDAVCISGDVHDPQIINENIFYVGSPCLCDFGDDYQPRVLLLDGLNMKSIKVYGQQKRLIEMNWDQGKPARVVTSNFTDQNDIVKIRVHLEMEQVAEWATIRQEVETWATKKNFIVNTIQPIVETVEGARQQITKSAAKSDQTYFESFVKRLGVDEKTALVGKDMLGE